MSKYTPALFFFISLSLSLRHTHTHTHKQRKIPNGVIGIDLSYKSSRSYLSKGHLRNDEGMSSSVTGWRKHDVIEQWLLFNGF